ncbi:MAG TPA: hypothetical protein VKX35_11525 [Fermentimonas sp.]|nr:hypothetical protein [Fermentimonas sp.]
MTETIQTSLLIAIIGIIGIYIFMFIFYLLIKLLDMWFPNEKENHKDNIINEMGSIESE